MSAISNASSENMLQRSQVLENNTPARSEAVELCCLMTVVALVAIALVGTVAAGITLTVLGALHFNPLMMDIGIALIVLPILLTAKATILFFCVKN